MAQQNLNERARHANQRLHELCFELRGIAIAARNALDFDTAQEFAAAVDAVIAAQASLGACELVVDAARDEKDQSFAGK
jgi:molybdopterin/thiamine biosynthesis adenylyltransferase